MLRVLLDEHIHPGVHTAAQQVCKGLQVVTLHQFMDGHFIGASDVELLKVCRESHLTLLTFDLKTIPLVLRSWADEGLDHGGVLFVDERSFSQKDAGGIARALCRLWNLHGTEDWTNRACFLQRPRR